MADGLTVSVPCLYGDTRVSIVPPEGDTALQHLIVCCGEADVNGCGHYYTVRFEGAMTYWAQTAPLAFGEEEELGPRQPHGLPGG